ncbi:hypothetical protein [Hyphomonas sp.]|uniref:hypothetical protein n=1 Tax=Hyphomonas sp. TaxID=87 RepID=UPI0025B9222F|nr:hypothetical protein [Hyphomonas sp.]
MPEDLIRDWPFQFGTIYKGNPYVDLVDPLLREAPEVLLYPRCLSWRAASMDRATLR